MATISEQLAEAQAVYHEWRLGRTARSYADSNGEAVSYSTQGLAGLPAYIAELKRQLFGDRPILSVKFKTSKGL
jgi:gpW